MKVIGLPSLAAVATAIALNITVVLGGSAPPHATAAGLTPAVGFQQQAVLNRGNVVVHPKFGGQILGYDIDQSGNEGVLSEYVDLPGGKALAATETFDQSTGNIIRVVAKTKTQDDFDTQGVFGAHVGIVLYQHAGQNQFAVMNPLNSNEFTGFWTPPLKKTYQVSALSRSQGTRNVAAYQSSFTGPTFVFSSNVAENTFGPLISLAPIVNGTEFTHPLIARDSKSNQAVLADSLGCPEAVCTTDIALVDLTTGKIRKFTAGLGEGTVDGLAVDPATGIACTTTLVDGGVEFYDLARQIGFEVKIPDGSELDAGLDVEFDPIHRVFLVEQYSSTGNPNDPRPRIYVYDEKGNVKETIAVQRIGVSPALIALNPSKRIGFIPVIVEPQHEFLALQSFSY
jgi:hypothetical protein